MDNTNVPANVEAYMSELPEMHRLKLEKLRQEVKMLVPEAKEIISYMMPTFQYKGKILLHIAAFKKHYSLFPGKAPIETFKTELKGYKTSAGTIQIPLEEDFPQDILKKIVEMRMGDIEFTLEKNKKKK